MLIFGINVLQYYGRYQCHCVPVLNLILVPVKEHLHGRTLGMNDSLKGDLLFENEIRNAY